MSFIDELDKIFNVILLIILSLMWLLVPSIDFKLFILHKLIFN